MSNSLLYETFIFGNLELVYTRRKLKRITLQDFIDIIKDNKDLELGEMWLWRFYKNYKYLYSTYENDIITDKNKGLLFIELLENFITLTVKIESDIKNKPLPLIALLYELKERLKNISIFNESSNIFFLSNLFEEKFNYLLADKIIILDYILPYEKNIWSPSWCTTIEDKKEIIKHVDIHIDYYFLFPDVRFNSYMNNDISELTKRLDFLQSKTNIYYNNIIIEKINYLTKNIFSSYPYKIIYEDYLKLAKKYSEVYIPVMLKNFNLDIINNDIWLLAILPKYLSAYLLGFPVISSDVPNEKNLSKILEKIIKEGIVNYWNYLYELNNSIIQLKSMDIDCGNNNEEGKILDVTFTPVEEYNMDDTFLLFNEGVFYIFTYPEFEDLINKERNPYNRNHIPLLASTVAAIKFKKKLKRQLNNRYLDVDLNSTMEENFNLIKEKIIKDNNFISDTSNYNNFTNSLINMFLANNFIN